MDADLVRLEQEKMMRDSEKRITDRLTEAMNASEQRILAAIGAAPARTTSPPVDPVELLIGTQVFVPETCAPEPDPIREATRDPVRARVAKKTVAVAEPEMVESNLAPPSEADWVAIPDARSTSGVWVEQSCKEAYNRVRQSRTGVRWARFDFNNSMSWIYPSMEGMATEDYQQDWADFVEGLPDGKACYVLYNFEYADEGGSGYSQGGDVLKNKMILFSWTDNKCRVKQKMVSASSQSAIKFVCRGCMDQAVHEKEDMEYGYMMKQLNC